MLFRDEQGGRITRDKNSRYGVPKWDSPVHQNIDFAGHGAENSEPPNAKLEALHLDWTLYLYRIVLVGLYLFHDYDSIKSRFAQTKPPKPFHVTHVCTYRYYSSSPGRSRANGLKFDLKSIDFDLNSENNKLHY